jgi:flavin-binding protein dodecin
MTGGIERSVEEIARAALNAARDTMLEVLVIAEVIVKTPSVGLVVS